MMFKNPFLMPLRVQEAPAMGGRPKLTCNLDVPGKTEGEVNQHVADWLQVPAQASDQTVRLCFRNGVAARQTMSVVRASYIAGRPQRLTPLSEDGWRLVAYAIRFKHSQKPRFDALYRAAPLCVLPMACLLFATILVPPILALIPAHAGLGFGTNYVLGPLVALVAGGVVSLYNDGDIWAFVGATAGLILGWAFNMLAPCHASLVVGAIALLARLIYHALYNRDLDAHSERQWHILPQIIELRQHMRLGADPSHTRIIKQHIADACVLIPGDILPTAHAYAWEDTKETVRTFLARSQPNSPSADIHLPAAQLGYHQQGGDADGDTDILRGG